MLSELKSLTAMTYPVIAAEKMELILLSSDLAYPLIYAAISEMILMSSN